MARILEIEEAMRLERRPAKRSRHVNRVVYFVNFAVVGICHECLMSITLRYSPYLLRLLWLVRKERDPFP